MVFMKERERLQKKLEKNMMFQKYLYKVVENAEEFHEIREIIARYDTLTATHEVGIYARDKGYPVLHRGGRRVGSIWLYLEFKLLKV